MILGFARNPFWGITSCKAIICVEVFCGTISYGTRRRSRGLQRDNLACQTLLQGQVTDLGASCLLGYVISCSADRSPRLGLPVFFHVLCLTHPVCHSGSAMEQFAIRGGGES